jgi:hypothetical protein
MRSIWRARGRTAILQGQLMTTFDRAHLFTRMATAARVLVVALGLFLVGRHCQRGFVGIGDEVSRLAAQGKILVARGGDVALRDIPKAHEFLGGHFFSDPYYQGESHWYPFVTPLLAAVTAKIGGHEVPEAYFRLEVITTGLFLAGTLALMFGLLGWWGPALWAFALLFGWLVPGHGLYPGEAVRGPFCLFILLLGVTYEGAAERSLPWWRYLPLGFSVGLLGLWNGATFFSAFGLTLLFVVGPLVLSIVRDRDRRAAGLSSLMAVTIGAAVPLVFLFGPQLWHYGTLVVPRAAASWLDGRYARGSAVDVLRLALFPREPSVLLVVPFLARVFFPGPLGLPRWRRALPLAAAFGACALVSHLGFVFAGSPGGAMSRAVRSLLPAPPHTFWLVTEALLPVVKVLGLSSSVEILRRLLPRLRDSRLERLVLAQEALVSSAIGALLFIALIPTFPASPPRYSAVEDARFYEFAKRVAATVGSAPVFFRYPGRFVQAGALKIPLLSVDEYASPYVQSARRRAVDGVYEAVAAGNTASAESFFSRYGLRFVMEDPRAKTDPVVLHCGGAALVEYQGYVLRTHEGCRP